MKAARRVSLLWKMLIWLLLHLGILALGLVFLVKWQFRSGLDGLLRGPAGDRLRAAGEQMSGQLRDRPISQWKTVLDLYSQQYGVECDLWLPHGEWVEKRLDPVPKVVSDRLRDIQGPRPGEPNFGPGLRKGLPGNPFDPGQPRPPGGPERADRGREEPPLAAASFQLVRPVFLVTDEKSDHYWAAVRIPLVGRRAPDHAIWIIRADDISGNGLFFDSQPWFISIAAILGFSILFWLPFALGITRYVKKLKHTTDLIAEGQFALPALPTRADELGSLGAAITSMSARIDHLIKGQKRFLGDVAHELCSPLARMRTGLGILEARLPESEWQRLADIETEAAELAELIDGILAFSRSTAGMQHVKGVPLPLLALLQDVCSREAPQLRYTFHVDSSITVLAEAKLLRRALSNIIRNSVRYAGDTSEITITADLQNARVLLQIADNGPGVSEEAIEHLFEPFYRPDTARTRETGGVGLGLTIVKSCIEAIGGSVKAANAHPHGFLMEISLPTAEMPILES